MPEIIVKLGDNVVQKCFLYKDVITIGRAPDNEITIENLAISRHHATIVRKNGEYQLEDHNSANGTYVNGVRIGKTKIVDKDVVSIGKHKLYFYNAQAEAESPLDLSVKTMIVSSAQDSPPVITILHGKQAGENYKIEKKETTVGRAADNDIRVNDWFVSKHHAVISRKGAAYVIRDLGSWRHTLVNGAIVEEQALRYGDRIQLGPKIILAFEKAAEDQEAAGGRVPVEIDPEASQALPVAKSRFMADEMPTAGAPSAAFSGASGAGAPLPFAGAAADASAHEAENGWRPRNEDEASADSFLEAECRLEAPDTAARAFEQAGAFSFEEEIAIEPPAEEYDPGERDAAEAEAQASEPSESSPESDKAAAVIETVSKTVSQAAEAETAEVALWLQALQNKSAVVRKHAQRKLKVLTGRHYDVEQ